MTGQSSVLNQGKIRPDQVLRRLKSGKNQRGCREKDRSYNIWTLGLKGF